MRTIVHKLMLGISISWRSTEGIQKNALKSGATKIGTKKCTDFYELSQFRWPHNRFIRKKDSCVWKTSKFQHQHTPSSMHSSQPSDQPHLTTLELNSSKQRVRNSHHIIFSIAGHYHEVPRFCSCAPFRLSCCSS